MSKRRVHLLGLIGVAVLVAACQPVAKPEPSAGSGSPKAPIRTALVRRNPGAHVNPATVRDADPAWKFASNEIYKGQEELDAMEARLDPATLDKYVLRRGPRGEKLVTLTFDDGPHPAYTPKLLEILKEKNVKATFFVIGHMAETYPDLIRQIAADGHDLANHTYSHVTLTKIPAEEIDVEYKANNDVVFELTGKRMRYCRPPGGDHDIEVLRRAGSLGLTTVLWTDDPGDYSNPGPDVLLTREEKELNPGGIILLHDGSRDTLATLGTLIDSVQAKGYRFVGLDEFRKGK